VKPFAYLTPSTPAEAVGLLGQHGPQAQVIAGGQSLLLAMKTRTARPAVLVSLAGVADLSGVGSPDRVSWSSVRPRPMPR